MHGENITAKWGDKLSYGYGVIEQGVLNTIQEVLILREKTSVVRNFRDEAASTVVLYGYPKNDGNVVRIDSNPRQNMPKYLDSVRQTNRSLFIPKLALSGFTTEHRYENGDYINPDPISEAQAAKNYYESAYDSDTYSEIEVYNLESIEGQSKFVEQLHNSLIELRRSGENNIVVHARIQDTLRVRLVLEKLRKRGKISNNIKTEVISHPWELDEGDTRGSFAFSLIKYWSMDRRTINRLPNYNDGDL
jgi:hypothetical protein